MLRNPLGWWKKQNKNRQHTAYYDNNSDALYRFEGQLWQKFKEPTKTRRQLIFRKTAQTLEMNLPHHWITGLPAQRMVERTPNTRTNDLEGEISRIQEKHKAVLNILMEEGEILDIFTHPTRVKIASDGGFNPKTGKSSYGWVIAANKILIAKGRGAAAAHPDLAESFRAEGFGLEAALQFLEALTKQLHIDKDQHSWRFYLDNKAMIQRMESYDQSIQHSKWNLRPDADITN
jgi:ribonuclease HI